jgi:tetratricopeptide (TPR) repeat protein
MKKKVGASKPKAAKAKKQIGPPPPVHVGMPLPSGEKRLKQITKLAKEGQFKNLDELNASLRQAMMSGELDRVSYENSPAEQAQDLAYQAMEEPSSAKARKLAEKALRLDPDCVDAIVVRAQTRRLTSEEYIAELRKAVEAGARTLGKERFQKGRGIFWGMVDTRPYMRARAELAQAFIGAEQLSEAAREIEGMLDLNPNDNQGMRDYLLGVYLAQGDLEGAASVYRRYQDDDSAVFTWGRVFFSMLSGRRAEARQALERAFLSNPWVATFFFGEAMPGDPPSWVVGSKEEGDHAASALLPAAAEHPDVVVWIAKESIGVMKGIMVSERPPINTKIH